MSLMCKNKLNAKKDSIQILGLLFPYGLCSMYVDLECPPDAPICSGTTTTFSAKINHFNTKLLQTFTKFALFTI